MKTDALSNCAPRPGPVSLLMRAMASLGLAFSVHAQTPIHDIQGSGGASPLVGQTVITTGIVTARKSNGFFVEADPAEWDANPDTSEGIFIFTSSAPPASAALGNRVQVTGTVLEFRPSGDSNSFPLTELTFPVTQLLSFGHSLPTPVLLTAAELSPAGSAGQLERYEGMRVRVTSLTVVAPTQGVVLESSAGALSRGLFHGVISGTVRPFRESGIPLLDALPVGAPAVSCGSMAIRSSWPWTVMLKPEPSPWK